MRLTYDWATSNTAERVLNLVLRPLGLDCFVEAHTVGSWQWGIDMPSGDHTALHLWAGPLHVVVSRV